jgi:hypothetical protein
MRVFPESSDLAGTPRKGQVESSSVDHPARTAKLALAAEGDEERKFHAA